MSKSKYDFIKYTLHQTDHIPVLRILNTDNPVLSNRNLDYHYNVLYANYIRLAEDDPSNVFAVGGEQLHTLFFEQLSIAQANNAPNGKAKELINRNYNGFMQFKHKFITAALDIQGSGWCYMDTKGDIGTISNHSVLDNVAIIVDMWEHSWILDYLDKEDYLNNIWKIIDWDIINARLK